MVDSADYRSVLQPKSQNGESWLFSAELASLAQTFRKAACKLAPCASTNPKLNDNPEGTG